MSTAPTEFSPSTTANSVARRRFTSSRSLAASSKFRSAAASRSAWGKGAFELSSASDAYSAKRDRSSSVARPCWKSSYEASSGAQTLRACSSMSEE